MSSLNSPIFKFERGTLTTSADTWSAELQALLSHRFQYDSRTTQYRSEACHYGECMVLLHKNKITYTDEIKQFEKHSFVIKEAPTPRPYQLEALLHWQQSASRGCVILPTGSGKSFLAQLAIQAINRDTLILVPTLDLLEQWVKNLEKSFQIPIGRLGGGVKDIQPITVSTYDSAQIMTEYIGNRFAFLIADECHHLPGATYRYAAIMSIAPFRLGLTATPERSDGGQVLLTQLMGPIAYEQHIHELRGTYLSEYQTHCVEVPLTDKEELAYKNARQIYTDFLKEQNVDFSRGDTWQDFLSLCFRSDAGKKAHRAFREQKDILRTSENKLKKLYEIICEHKSKSILIFTDDNDTAYKIGELFVLPVITHQTKPKERKSFLENFKNGNYPILVSSKVLNEGVDVPEASVGIILSGSGSQREHVQRLGRILRKGTNKNAKLFELISKGTSEKWQSQRRRQHAAYKR